LLREVLSGPLVFTPDGEGYHFRAGVATSELIARAIAAGAQEVASPGAGVEMGERAHKECGRGVQPEGLLLRQKADKKAGAVHNACLRRRVPHERQLTVTAPSRTRRVDAKLYDPEVRIGVNLPEDVLE
jgi:hypothetical protein